MLRFFLSAFLFFFFLQVLPEPHAASSLFAPAAGGHRAVPGEAASAGASHLLRLWMQQWTEWSSMVDFGPGPSQLARPPPGGAGWPECGCVMNVSSGIGVLNKTYTAADC